MEMHASRPLAASQQQAWEALNDAETLKACLSGCEKFEALDEASYAVTMAVKVGPVSARFNGKITLSEVVAPESYTMAFEGQGGVAGFGTGQAKVRLLPQEDAGQCLLDYAVQAQVGGKIAQLGQRLIDGAARNMAEDFFARFDALMRERNPAQGEEEDADSSARFDTRTWEHDAAMVSSSSAPLDATPAAAPQDKGRLPIWTWLLGLIVVLGALWLLSR